MPKLITETLQYYDWNDVETEVAANCGRKLRDWAGKFSGKRGYSDEPYLDFWHKMLDYDPEIRNGYIRGYDFDEIADAFPTEPWVREICNEYIKILGPGEHTFKIWW